MIKHLFFDLGNVLMFFDHERALRRISVKCGKPMELVHQAVFASGLEDRYETGLVSDEEFVNQVASDLDFKFELNWLLNACADIFEPNLAMLPALRHAKSLGLPMTILSNTCSAHWKWIELQRYPTVDGWFEQRILSYEEKSMKPSNEIYEAAEALAKVAPNQLFFVDDRRENVQAAADRGWNTIHFQDAESFQVEFQRLFGTVSS